jgi:hypothetical protein
LKADNLDRKYKDETVRMSSNKDIVRNVPAGAKFVGNINNKFSKVDFRKMNEMSNRTMKAAKIAKENLHLHSRSRYMAAEKPSYHGNNYLNPGDPAKPFNLLTLNGPLIYPGPVVNKTTSILFHAFTQHCGFVDALWHSEESLASILMNSPGDVHYILLSSSVSSSAAIEDAEFMKRQLVDASKRLHSRY